MIRLLWFVTIVCCFPQMSQKPADSPVTSTPFYKAYLDVELVAEAAQTHELSPRMLTFLLRRRHDLDQKLALLNALGWEENAMDNRVKLEQAIMEKRKISVLSGDSKMRAHDQLLIGYMMLLENYGAPQLAVAWIEKGVARLSNRLSAHTILALCKAQISFGHSWCEVWKHYETVMSHTEYKHDLRAEAGSIIFDYLVLYRDSCTS